MVQIPTPDGGNLYFDLMMIASIMIPSRLSPNQFATVVIMTGANINVPIEIGEQLIKEIELHARKETRGSELVNPHLN